MVELSEVKHCAGVGLEKEMEASRKFVKFDSTFQILPIDTINSQKI